VSSAAGGHERGQSTGTIIAATIGAVAVVIAAIIGGLIGGDVVNVSLGSGSATPAPAQTVTVTRTAPAPTSNTPVSDPTSASTAQPSEDVRVRRTTEGHKPLILSSSYFADLDSLNPAWDVAGSPVSDHDVSFTGSRFSARSNTDIAVAQGPKSYETCETATAYFDYYEADELSPNTHLCWRTSERRYAYVTVKKVTRSTIQLEVTVWDPPFEE
jgi:hypothetical protein